MINLLALLSIISWSNPSTYVDGSPLPIEEISRTKIYYQRQDGSSTGQVVEVPAPATTYSLQLVPGQWCFILSTVTVQENESDPANPVCHKVTGKPNSPTTVVIVFGR